ncbi:hypothetical protein LSH36_441g00021 [Paralvinella palmiformis]|uniref:Ergosterol biosynthetic protein 28 n=1 Tax=Paralvinella palmiformis TaxID=53620 RepID=A0AAD9MZQ7_9ANNE|nr:hypothetical protein LSH36_441g00021 [Paralvinella palmiformis]
MSKFFRYLQGWIGVVGMVAFGNTLSCFRGHQILSDKLYTDAHGQVNALMARIFGVWTLLSAVIRIYCAYDIKNRAVYNLTYFSFVLAFIHFIAECFFYKTAPLTVGVMMPLAVSALSLVWMSIGYFSITDNIDEEDLRKIRSPQHIPQAYVFKRRPKSS